MWTTPAREEPDSFMVGGESQNILEEGIYPTIYRGGDNLPKLMFLPLKTAGVPKPAVISFAIFCRIFEKIRHI